MFIILGGSSANSSCKGLCQVGQQRVAEPVDQQQAERIALGAME